MFTGASWQRCRTHFMANLLTRVPKRAQPGVAAMVRTIYQQLSPAVNDGLEMSHFYGLKLNHLVFAQRFGQCA